MRTLLFYILWLLVLCTEFAASAVPIGFNEPTIPGLVGWWTFNEGSGTNANDYSGYGNSCVCSNLAAANISWTNGVVGGGIYTAGSSPYYWNVTSNSTLFNFGTNAFSISFWFLPNAQVNTYPSLIANMGPWASGAFAIRFSNSGTANELTAHLNGGAPGDPLLEIKAVLLTNVWCHAVLTKDQTVSSASNWTFYTNGVLATNHSVGTMPLVNLQKGGNMRFGWDTWDASGYYKGSLDDIRIYNRTLTSDEVKRLYNGGYGSQH